MTRPAAKRALTVALVLLVVTGAAALGRSISGSTKSERTAPNVLVIVTDDQRARGTLGVMPETRAWFGAGGTRFQRAFATTPLCCPSRASILTGRYSHNHGVLRNQDGPELDFAATLPRYLANAGYRTAISGKFIQGMRLAANPPYFDAWAVFSWGYFDRRVNLNGKMTQVDGYITDFLGRWAQGFLEKSERDDSRPWFLYLAPSAPHKPYAAAPRYKDAATPPLEDTPAFHERNRSDKPAFVRTRNLTRSEIHRRLQRYLNVLHLADDLRSESALIDADPFSRLSGLSVWRRQLNTLRSVDDVVGQLADTLKRLQEDNTLAVFLSDNGLLLGEHGLFGKRVPYAEAVHIPLVMRWPGEIEAGGVDRRLAANIDVLPTILDAAGVDDIESVDGSSLLAPATRSELLIEQLDNSRAGSGLLPEWSSLLTGSFQYVEYRDQPGEPVSFREYYDLVSDPWQKTNLLEDGDPSNDPDVETLSDRLVSLTGCDGSDCP
jgi:arylsulfatase A-like enzyme